MSAPTRIWSALQNAIYGFVETGTGNGIIVAVAGSGKTSTIEESFRRIPRHLRAIFLAFNKAIAVELERRGVAARTFHSLCYGPVMRARGARNVNPTKLRDLVDAKLGQDDVRMYGAFITKLVSLGRQQGLGALEPDTTAAWDAIVAHHELELDAETASYERALELASELLAWSNASKEVDFDDLLYLAVRDGIALPKYDFVFVDEAQDTNTIQRAILRKICHNGTRLVAVGDPAQAIYGFRGADSDSMDLIAKEFDAQRFPLSVSYRCPQAVVRHAQQWVSYIEAAPTAPEGSVVALGTKWDPKVFAPNDLVVCRTTAPLISLAYKLLKARVPVMIMGKEIGAGLASLVNRMRARGLEHLASKLQAYATREVEKAVAKKQDAKAAAVQDKVDALLFLIDSLAETERTVPALLRLIESLFADTRNAVVLATIHKSKGLEANHVYWLNSSRCPAKWARQEWQQQQERNLCYVATTRAKQTLTLIEMEEGK
jgi:DNA helicase II / ATP-dependent DNA helicase PcrA